MYDSTVLKSTTSSVKHPLTIRCDETWLHGGHTIRIHLWMDKYSYCVELD